MASFHLKNGFPSLFIFYTFVVHLTLAMNAFLGGRRKFKGHFTRRKCVEKE